MIKVKVVKCLLDISLKHFVEKIASLTDFGPQDNYCTLVEYSDSSLSAVYVEKVVARETIIDIHGNETEIDVVRYPRYEFQIQHFGKEGEYLLLIFNPPRSLKALVNFLTLELSNKIYFREMKLSIENFVSRASLFEEFSHFTVDKVRAKGVQVSGSSYADVSISSTADAYKDIESFLDRKSYKVSNIRMRVKTKYGHGKVEVSSAGLLGVDQNVFDEVLDFFFSSAKDIVIY